MTRLPRLLVILVVLAFAACAGADDALVTPGPTGNAQGAPGGPNIAIDKPINGSTIPAGNVKVRVTVTRFDLVSKLGKGAALGKGHVHYYLDPGQIPTTPGQPAVLEDPSRYHASSKTSYTWKDVEPGPHMFAVQLVNNDHTPLEPPITAATSVTVERS